MLPLPDAFTTTFENRFGPAELAAYREALLQPTPTSIRLNSAKAVVESYLPPGEPVPWHPAGRYLAERPIFTLDPVFQAGGYYPQEASSMFIDYLLRQFGGLDRINLALDLCAAPGGKSTLLRSVLRPEAVMVANEVIKARHRTLRYNLAKWWGCPRPGPPTWTPSASRPWRAASIWSWWMRLARGRGCSAARKVPVIVVARQRGCGGAATALLAAAVPLLRPGGLFIYLPARSNGAETEEQLASTLESACRPKP